MRLAQIEIKDYKQFEHLELDLTYSPYAKNPAFFHFKTLHCG